MSAQVATPVPASAPRKPRRLTTCSGEPQNLRVMITPRVLRASQQFSEFLDGQTGVANDPTQGECLDGIVPWNRDLQGAIAHHDMFSLANYLEARFLQCSYRVQVIDARNFRHR